jgi:hypothetical protein
MPQLLLGLTLIAIAAVLGFYGTQLAREGWTKLGAPPTAAIKPAAPPRPRILFVENRLILPSSPNEPLRIALGLMNRGDADGTVTLKDRTYYFSTDPTQKRFKYQASTSVETPVLAVPNAIWRGEMRFDFQLTPEKLAALKAGAARLFFFARCEYRDEAGNTYPLPFSGMYDPQFSGNLIACPSDVVFE